MTGAGSPPRARPPGSQAAKASTAMGTTVIGLFIVSSRRSRRHALVKPGWCPSWPLTPVLPRPHGEGQWHDGDSPLRWQGVRHYRRVYQRVRLGGSDGCNPRRYESVWLIGKTGARSGNATIVSYSYLGKHATPHAPGAKRTRPGATAPAYLAQLCPEE